MCLMLVSTVTMAQGPATDSPRLLTAQQMITLHDNYCNDATVLSEAAKSIGLVQIADRHSIGDNLEEEVWGRDASYRDGEQREIKVSQPGGYAVTCICGDGVEVEIYFADRSLVEWYAAQIVALGYERVESGDAFDIFFSRNGSYDFTITPEEDVTYWIHYHSSPE